MAAFRGVCAYMGIQQQMGDANLLCHVESSQRDDAPQPIL